MQEGSSESTLKWLFRSQSEVLNTRRLRSSGLAFQIIFHFFWDHWAHYGTFEDGVLLMYMLEGVSSIANFITAYEESQ